MILGINAYHGDASAAIVVDGQLVAAVEEERFTRVKHDTSFPLNSIRYCLTAANATIQDIDHIALSRNPRANIPRRVRFALGSRAGRKMAAQRGASLLKTLRAKATVAEGFGVAPGTLRADVHFVEHHLAHIASSFYVSPFDRAAVLSVDGFGDMVSAMWGRGEGTKLRIDGEVTFPHSLGVFYTAFTQFLGFPNYGDEYKVMGLASYGEPEFLETVREVVREDGIGFELDLSYFRHHREGLSMTWNGGPPVLGPLWGPGMVSRFGPPRSDGSEPVEPRHQNIASSMQRRLEEILLAMLNELHRRTGIDRLCLAGGVALNCVANGLIRRETPFRELYVQPAANDAGTSVGAAFYVQHQLLGRERAYVMDHAFLGPEFSENESRSALTGAGVTGYRRLDDRELIERTADALAAGKIVGWYQGRMEFGPRALGNRSILVDPRRAEMKDVLNARIKHREPFRPFAPSLLEEATGEFFEDDYPSPFMLLTYPVKKDKRDVIPAPTHVDGTGRLQTVRRDQNARYYDLIKAFGDRTGVPVLLNTSFNENEPICRTPAEAVETFQRTKMDVLALGNLFCER